MEIFMQVSDEIFTNLVAKTLKQEARLSDRQVYRTEWSQFHGRLFQVSRSRAVVLSDELHNALASLPVDGRKVFKNSKRSSLLLDMPECPERVSTPVREMDDCEKLAKLLAEKLLR